MNRIFLSPPHMGGRELEYLNEAFASNYIAPVGPFLDRFESSFCDLTGFNHCVAVSSGTAAIHLGLRHLGVSPGDAVIGSTLTFIGSVSPITFLGAEPVFVDSEASTWNMCPVRLEEAIDQLKQEGRRIGAVIPTDLYGQSCRSSEISDICAKHDIPLMFDSAEALGATYKGKSTGKLGAAAAFSFNGNKILTTSGGGILASDDLRLIDRARYLATQTREPVVHFEHQEIGYNYRLSNLLAAIGVAQLENLSDRVAKKREIFDWYVKRLGEIPGVEFMRDNPDGVSSRWLTTLMIEPKEFGCDRETVRLALEESNIESRPAWKPMHLQPCFSGSRTFGGGVAEGIFDRGLCLPSGTQLEEDDVERIVELILSSRK